MKKHFMIDKGIYSTVQGRELMRLGMWLAKLDWETGVRFGHRICSGLLRRAAIM
jgi:hypothetical protein